MQVGSEIYQIQHETFSIGGRKRFKWLQDLLKFNCLSECLTVTEFELWCIVATSSYFAELGGGVIFFGPQCVDMWSLVDFHLV